MVRYMVSRIKGNKQRTVSCLRSSRLDGDGRQGKLQNCQFTIIAAVIMAKILSERRKSTNNQSVNQTYGVFPR